MKTLIAERNWLNLKDTRFDASFHLSDGRLSKIQIDRCPYEIRPLISVTKEIYNGARFRRYYVNDPQKGIPFMGSSDMSKPELTDLKYISKKLSKNAESLRIQKDWILVSCSGTIGNTVYTNDDFANKTASQHIMRIIPNEDIYPGFLYAFLSSRFGYALLSQGTYGAVIQHIESHHIKDLPIPMLPEKKQKEIHELIIKSSALRAEANAIKIKLVHEIDFLLKKEYLETKNVKSSTVSFEDINRLEKRFDAPYNVGLGRFLYDNIISNKYKLLSDLSEVFHPMLFGKKQMKGSVTKGNPLYKSSSMMKTKPETDFWLSLKKVSSYSKLQVKEGWVLISRTGTVGNVVRINKSMDGVFIDDHMIRVKPEKQYAGLIYIYLKSFFGQKLIEFQKYGSVQEVINSEYIERIPIPQKLIKEDILKEFNTKVNEASDKIDNAVIMEKKAIDLIEKEIESWQK
jgi:type I restriction enzyme, S subunit